MALIGAIVTSAFKRGFTSRLIDAGFPPRIADSIVAKAGAKAAAGGGTAAGFRRQAPPGTPIRVIDQVVNVAHQAFVHAMHVGVIMAICGMVLAALAAAIFVRSHVEPANVAPAGDGAGAHVG